MEKLAHKIQNTDFKNFLDGVNSCVAAKHDWVAVSSILTNAKHFDPILSEETLRASIVIKEEADVFLFEETVTSSTLIPSSVSMNQGDVATTEPIFKSIQSQHPEAFTNSQPLRFKIKDKDMPFTLWKDFLKEVCLYLKEDNPMLFQQYCYPTEDFSATLFFNDVSDKWVAGRLKKGKQIELEEGLYVVSDLNARAIVKLIQDLMKTFDIPDMWVKIALAD